MRPRATGLALAGALALAACAGEAVPAPGRSPLGGTWTVLSVGGEVIDERMRASVLQFQVQRVVQVVDRCRDLEAPVKLDDPDGIVFGGFSDVRPAVACDPEDLKVSRRVLAALRGVTRYSGGRPGDRLMLSGSGEEIVLAQPAANPTWCADC